MAALQVEAIGEVKPIMGWAAWTQLDALLREQDLDVLRWADVSVAAVDDVALTLSPLERGETTKTGPSQGVTILDCRLARWFSSEKLKHQGDDKVFNLPLYKYRRIHNMALAKYAMEELGGPHVFRHSGAIRLIQRGFPEGKKWSFPRTQGRGRWALEKSVHHYAKPHLVTKNRSRLSPDQREKGMALWRSGLSFAA